MFFVIALSSQHEANVVISSGFDYDWKDKTACDIYLHKGYFGMYVVDSAVYKEDLYYSTTLVAE